MKYQSIDDVVCPGIVWVGLLHLLILGFAQRTPQQPEKQQRYHSQGYRNTYHWSEYEQQKIKDRNCKPGM